MRENQLGNVSPGRTLRSRSTSCRASCSTAGFTASVGVSARATKPRRANCHRMPADQGWLRDPQQFPVRILLLPDDAKEAGIDVGRSGAQANVIIFTNDKFDHEPDRSAVDQGRGAAELPAIAMATRAASRRTRRPGRGGAAAFHSSLRVRDDLGLHRMRIDGLAAFGACAGADRRFLASLPASPPPKVGLVLIVIMAMLAPGSPSS